MSDANTPAYTDLKTAERQAAWLVVGTTVFLAGAAITFPVVGAMMVVSAGMTVALDKGINLLFANEKADEGKPAPKPIAVAVWEGLSKSFSLVKADVLGLFGRRPAPKLEEVTPLASAVAIEAPKVASLSAAKEFGASVTPAPVAPVAAAPVVEAPKP